MTIEHISSLGGYRAGDVVRIVGERGSYRVRGASRSERSPEGWLDLFGGPPGRESYRAVRPHAVTLVSRRPPPRLPIPGLEKLDVRRPPKVRPPRDHTSASTEPNEQATLFER